MVIISYYEREGHTMCKSEQLSIGDTFYVSVMLFGLFFGAGNLIFPIYMGHMAGYNLWPAIAGFLVTGVGIPLLGMIALGVSCSNGLLELSARVGKKYSYFFTCALYLTIGPLFASPRCATVSYTIGIEPILGANSGALSLAIFSFVFFVIVLTFSLTPMKILMWVGKILTPIFLAFLCIVIVKALSAPVWSIQEVIPNIAYTTNPFVKGFLEGYNTMDAIACLAFGITVINVIKGRGIKHPQAIAKNTVKAGFFSCVIMSIIYVAITIVGTQSSGLYDTCSNGGEIFAILTEYYYGKIGAIILAFTVTFACLKTAVGLITSCAESFSLMFTQLKAYRIWAFFFSLISFIVANLGLNAIIVYAIPVLMLLYPLVITLILMTLCSIFFSCDKIIYQSVTIFVFISSIFDFVRALPQELILFFELNSVITLGERLLPFYSIGMGWICPSLVGLCIGIFMQKVKKLPHYIL